MTITAAIVVFACVWFLTLFVVLPIGLRTQAEAGAVEPGTPASAPAGSIMRRKFLWTTAIAAPISAAIVAVIAWGGLTIQDIDVWGRM